jgi:hypothetical protein
METAVCVPSEIIDLFIRAYDTTGLHAVKSSLEILIFIREYLALIV